MVANQFSIECGVLENPSLLNHQPILAPRPLQIDPFYEINRVLACVVVTTTAHSYHVVFAPPCRKISPTVNMAAIGSFL